MNLTKLFNKNYAIQNIKKSKGILALLFLAMPIITLFIMYFYDKISYSVPFEMAPLFTINYLGMFVIPFIVSVVLMGFSYKKTSVDFICSMPINRKTIFVTNLITGIAYLVALQLFTLCITSLYMILIPESLFSIPMALDVFYMMTLSYIFIYSICMLASSVSGNIMTQIVVTMLILCIVPFTRMAIFGDVSLGAYSNIDISTKGVLKYAPVSMTYSLPISTAIYGFDSNLSPFGFEFVIKSMIYSMILSVVYVIVGIKLFEKRKLENAGTSFNSNLVHIIVKGLTLYPAMVVVVYLGMEESAAIFAFAIMMLAIYYLIYDLVTSKKMKFKLKVGSFAITILVLYLVTYGMIKSVGGWESDKLTKSVTADRISEISIALPEEYRVDYEYINIKNTEIKDYIINSLIDPKSDDYYKTGEQNISIRMIININGDGYSFIGTISRENMAKAIEMIRKDKKSVESFANTYVTSGKTYTNVQGYNFNIDRLGFSDEMGNYINNNKLKYIDKLLERTEDIVANNKHWGNGTVVTVNKYYNHKKHKYVIKCLPEFIDFEKAVAEEVNRHSASKLTNIKSKKGKVISNYSIYRKKDGILYSSDRLSGKMDNDLIDMNFVIQEASKKVDLNNEYYMFIGYCDGDDYLIYTSDVGSVTKHLKSKDIDINDFESVYTSEFNYDPNTDTYVYLDDDEISMPAKYDKIDDTYYDYNY